MREKMKMITCSYRPDLERCRRLCASVDRFVPDSVQHTLIVPARNFDAFKELSNDRRRVLTTQDVVPGDFHQAPGTERLWFDGRGWPIRGWRMQQTTKLSANHATGAELLLFADSDLQFIRDLDLADISEGQLRLHRAPGHMQQGQHLKWHHRGSSLLGLTQQAFGSDYIGQLICWRRSNLVSLQSHIEQQTSAPWQVPVSRSFALSEYTLYGGFVEHVLPPTDNGHFYSDRQLCHCCWLHDHVDALRRGKSTIGPDAVALLLQSNLGLNVVEEADILQLATR